MRSEVFMAVRTQAPVKRQHSGALSALIFYPEDEGSRFPSKFWWVIYKTTT